MTDERQMPDWLPQGSAWSLPEGTRSFGSTGQLFEVKGRRWVRVPPDVVPIYRPPHGDMTRAGVVAMIVCIVAALLALWVVHASARDLDGRYAQSPLKPWFDGLKSGKGLCCSDADGSAISDADWEVKDGRYRVRVPIVEGGNVSQWIDVPEDAVITEPNRAGKTMVWPLYGFMGVSIRCFMPGSMT